MMSVVVLFPLAACGQLQHFTRDVEGVQVNLISLSDQTYLLDSQGGSSWAVSRVVSKKAGQVCIYQGMKVGQMSRANVDNNVSNVDGSLQPWQHNGQYRLVVRFSCLPY
ncbi:hypothetical protein B0T39_12890 [Chromobacterium haemolyticum]|nr:hypothetical protein B0T39_12890 [Chromobacterium haemolyticum]